MLAFFQPSIDSLLADCQLFVSQLGCYQPYFGQLPTIFVQQSVGCCPTDSPQVLVKAQTNSWPTVGQLLVMFW